MLKHFKELLFPKNDSPHLWLRRSLNEIYKHAPVDFGGGCSFYKALVLASYIKEGQYKTSVDIGVYRGRSLFPQAISHKQHTGGVVYGIDPYNNIAAVQHDMEELRESLDHFAKTTDFDKMYKEVTTLISKFDLANYCSIIRQKSNEAKYFFLNNNLKIGLIHIDGNHDTDYVLNDVADYLPLIDRGGILVLDDISWQSVKPAFDLLKQQCTYIGELIDHENDFAVFLNHGTKDQVNNALKVFHQIKDGKNK